MKNFNYIVFSFFLVLMLFPVVDVFAGCFNITTCCGNNPPGGAFCDTCPPCVAVPFDVGLSALLIAGVAFGAKKVRSKLN
jgi:hypothetical protein